MPAPSAAELPTPTGDRLGDWVGWWLELRCVGCRSVDLPIAMLIRAHGHHHRLRDVIDRLRCEVCRKRPKVGKLTDQIGDPRYCSGKRVAEIPR